MSDNDTEQEKLFRVRYAEELRKKKQQNTHHYGRNRKRQDVEEKKIKQEEINKEIVRRDMIKNKRIPAKARSYIPRKCENPARNWIILCND